MSIIVRPNNFDFSELHQQIQWYVDEDIIPFANTLILQGDEVVDKHFYGKNTDGGSAPPAENAIFRMHSSTKIATSVAAMMLFEQGKFKLDDPIGQFIPELGEMSVLKPDAVSIEDTEPANCAISVRHLLSHTAGLSYGFIEPEGLIDSAYNRRGINPFIPGGVKTLEDLCSRLGEMPLVYHPGAFWRYSFATDVTARLVEVVSGQRFDEFLKTHIFNPLGMIDTDFFVPPEKLSRLTTMYAPNDALDPMSVCPTPADTAANPANSVRPSFLSGGGGLMSTLPDYLTFAKMIINQGRHAETRLLKPETLALMRSNQCAPGVIVNFPMWSMPGTGFGLGFALKGEPAPGEPVQATGEYHWGGMAGTHFWWSAQANIAGVCMTQRMPGFWHPFSHDFKRLAYQIVGI